jgi:hypothetical protein
MTITTDRATSFIAECFAGVHLTTDTYKAFPIKTGHAGTYNHLTANVGTPGTGTPSVNNLGTDEAAGTGYTSGGITLAAPSVTVNGRVIRFDFADPAALPNATLSADGIVIANMSKAGKVVGVFAFTNAPVVSTGGAYAVDMPAAGDATSLVHVS